MNYARLALFTLGPGTRSTAENLADQFSLAMEARKGFKNVTFIIDEVAGEYGALAIWETKEDAEASGAALESKLQEILKDILKSSPIIKQFEVYEPKR